MSWGERLVGIGLGILLGVGVVTAFVFAGSESTIDAPLLSTDDERAGDAAERRSPAPAEVQIVGGAPPASGPVRLHYREGDRIRLRITSDETLPLAVTGYGIERTVRGGETTPFDFEATKAGNLALVVATSHIAVAQIRVD